MVHNTANDLTKSCGDKISFSGQSSDSISEVLIS